jgi:hypothetical protein
VPVRQGRPEVRLYDGRLKARQDVHAAVLDIDVGATDLQQCADAVIRLRAEYLYSRNCESEIAFDFTSGDRATWLRWKSGYRPHVTGSRVSWDKTGEQEGQYAVFRRYLETVFEYAGTLSLERELCPLIVPRTYQGGEVFIQGGNPGHAVLVIDVAENDRGDRVMLLAQSYMPAQDIHVLRSPEKDLSPWYTVKDNGSLTTPEWEFAFGDARRFSESYCERRMSLPHADWQELEPGLELGVLPSPRLSCSGDSLVRVLRIDTERFGLRLMNASARADHAPLTAREWCREGGLLAAINASMYQQDGLTSVSHMLTENHVNNPHITGDKTILAFDRRTLDAPPVKIIDRQCEDYDVWKPKYATFIQSIRMISCRGRNVWAWQPRMWSTAAIGIDREGRVLFIHVRSPYVVHDLISVLQELPLDISRAMYAEGGPEAQFYVNNGVYEFEFVGSYESAFNENDDNVWAWRVPNVVGVVRRGQVSTR